MKNNIRESVKVGDKVTLKVDSEARDWGYNPGPDGIEVEVIGWSEIDHARLQSYGREPGIYENHSWPIVRFPDGQEKSIGSWNLKTDKVFWEDEKKKIRDLPETQFYEWDEVKVIGSRGFYNDRIITGIDYGWMKQKRMDGSPMPYYRVSPDKSAGSYCSYHDSELELVSRGLVWKYFHNEAYSFANEMEEFDFFYRLGHIDEVRNPRNQLYSWTKDELVESVRDGICDCMSLGNGMFGNGIRVTAIRYRDRELGERVRARFLREFAGSCVR